MRYSAFRIFREGLTGNKGWTPAWREPQPKGQYDIVIIGGGGHGLSTAYYLAKEFGITNVAVVEKGWLGSGNIGRNTTIIRSNYMLPGNEPFYEFSMKLWEGLEQDFNYNAHGQPAFDPQPVPFRSAARCLRAPRQRDDPWPAPMPNWPTRRSCGANCRSSTSITRVSRSRVASTSAAAARCATTRWPGDMRAAPTAAVLISSRTARSPVSGSTTASAPASTRAGGPIRAKKVAMCVAGSSGRVAAMAGMRLPIESHVLQAFVTEGLKPVLPGVITFGAGHFYVSQSDKGGLVFGGDIDGYNTYAQRGNLPVIEDVAEGGMAIMPMIGRARSCCAGWGGIMDMSMDGSPFIDKTNIEGLYFKRRLVLRRLQGDAGKRILLRTSSRAGRAAPDRDRNAARPVPARPSHRRKGPGRPAEPALRRDRHDHQPPPSRPPRRRRVRLFLAMPA